MEKWMNSKGGVTIPAAVRRKIGIVSNEKVDVVPLENGDLLLRRIEGKCVFCDGWEHVEQYMGKYVCCDCRHKLSGK